MMDPGALICGEMKTDPMTDFIMGFISITSICWMANWNVYTKFNDFFDIVYILATIAVITMVAIFFTLSMGILNFDPGVPTN